MQEDFWVQEQKSRQKSTTTVLYMQYLQYRPFPPPPSPTFEFITFFAGHFIGLYSLSLSLSLFGSIIWGPMGPLLCSTNWYFDEREKKPVPQPWVSKNPAKFNLNLKVWGPKMCELWYTSITPRFKSEVEEGGVLFEVPRLDSPQGLGGGSREEVPGHPGS